MEIHQLRKQKSTSLITGKKYNIPDKLCDKEEIDRFIGSQSEKKVVVVQGLGFVGAVMSLVVANALTEDYAVIGIDLPSPNTYWKICSLNEGIFPVTADDPKIQEYYKNAREKGNFLATYDPYAYTKADVIIVDINLDVKKGVGADNELTGFDVDLTLFKEAMRNIGIRCREDVLVLVETTVPPGTCQKVVQPIIQECLQKRDLSVANLKIAHSYERVMPGPKYVDSIQNFYRVYSGVDEASADAAESFLKTVIRTDEYPLTRLGNTNATEMAKVLENSFRAMNIAFIVEWSRFAEEAEVNLYEVVNAIRMRPTHKNIMLPGLGVGGYCLTKDPLLASWAKQNMFGSKAPLKQSEIGVSINDRMPLYAFEFLRRQYGDSLNGRTVLLLGVSYLSDVGDTRYTPVEGFYDQLLNCGCNVLLHDPHVSYWEERDVYPEKDLAKVLDGKFEIAVITTGHKEYRGNSKLIRRLHDKSSLMIYDTIGILTEEEINHLKHKHTVKVLGRGDI